MGIDEYRLTLPSFTVPVTMDLKAKKEKLELCFFQREKKGSLIYDFHNF